MAVKAQGVIVRQVLAWNLQEEYHYIHSAITSGYRFAAIDTEFPGTVYDPLHQKAYSLLNPEEYYSILKQNVDMLQIVQLGFTLFDAYGNMPHFNTGCNYVWQFNFSDFDKEIHPHNKDSISFLEKQGIDFSYNRKYGIDSKYFSVTLGLILPFKLTWITFQGSYDFALLIKVMTRQNLPDNVNHFMELVGLYFGKRSFDVKLITRCLEIHGGLEKVGKMMGLTRVTGECHQAGPDSLFTMQVFTELSRRYRCQFNGFNHKLYGLTSTDDIKDLRNKLK